MAQEWRRLQELYAGMGEEELQAVADEGYDLTDVAKQAINAEISRRNLKVVVRLAPPEPEIPEGNPDFDPANLDLKVAVDAENREQAGWVKKTLNDAGVPCYFGPDLLENIEALKFSADHPVAVRVLTNDYDRVRWVLRDFRSQFPSQDDKEEFPELTVHCPRCNSTEVVFLGFDSGGRPQDGDGEDPEDTEELADAEDAEDIPDAERFEPPAPGAKYNWSCDACGHQWEDDGMAS